jgi:hypothetical protein
MTDDWDGTERRADDPRTFNSTDKRLAVAIAEVRDLRDAAAKLAEAVTVRTDEFQTVVRQVAMLLAGLLIIIVVFSLWQVGRLNNELKSGHTEISCLLLTDPSGRTAQAVLDCQKGRS